jgi:hypothetical protein
MNLKMRLCQKIQELSYQESSAKRLEEYLLSAKPQDKIIQESQVILYPIWIIQFTFQLYSNSIICRN